MGSRGQEEAVKEDCSMVSSVSGMGEGRKHGEKEEWQDGRKRRTAANSQSISLDFVVKVSGKVMN